MHVEFAHMVQYLRHRACPCDLHMYHGIPVISVETSYIVTTTADVHSSQRRHNESTTDVRSGNIWPNIYDLVYPNCVEYFSKSLFVKNRTLDFETSRFCLQSEAYTWAA